MGGHNRTCLSQRWVAELDDEQIGHPAGQGKSRADPLDLTPRRGLVYDAPPVPRFTVCLAKEDATWQVMH